MNKNHATIDRERATKVNDIIKLKAVDSIKEANALLNNGWRLLDISKYTAMDGDGSSSIHFLYTLGLPKDGTPDA